MVNLLKKQDFSLPIGRFYTRENVSAFNLIHFYENDDSEELMRPDGWSAESAALLAESVVQIPIQTKSIEENTLPSWLWRRTAVGALRAQEKDARQIFHRVVGAAAYAGWKQDVFAGEAEARAFYDEICYMMAQRFIAIEPRRLKSAGLDWAYGLAAKPTKISAPAAFPAFETGNKKNKTNRLDIRNTSVDAVLGGNREARLRWQKFIGAGLKNGTLELHFADIAGDWGIGAPQTPAAALDLFAFRREDGAIDVEALWHAAKLLTLLLDLLEEPLGGVPAIGLYNLAPLLLSQAIAYDSDTGRATAAALAATVTAETLMTSARLAGLRGPSLDFAANRESVLRALRNHRRAAYGDRNDYEKISVLPAPLALDTGADLALIAAARHGWDEALELVQQHGLRYAQTDLSLLPALAYFMESTAPGIEPLRTLTMLRPDENENYRQGVHPAVGEALALLDYDAHARTALTAHIAGAGTLKNAPGVNHAALRRRGFDEETLERVEAYLPFVNDLRLAFTPWIIGEKFCRDTLKIPVTKKGKARVDLLRHIGFSETAIKSANVFYYGHGNLRGVKVLRSEHAGIFATATQISPVARAGMAASVQSFISGDAGLHLELPEGASIEACETLLLSVWRQGIKSVSITLAATAPKDKRAGTKPAASPAIGKMPLPLSPPPYGAQLRSALATKPKARGKLISLRPRQTHRPARTEKP